MGIIRGPHEVVHADHVAIGDPIASSINVAQTCRWKYSLGFSLRAQLTILP